MIGNINDSFTFSTDASVAIQQWLQTPMMQTTGWCLLHSIWMIALASILVATALLVIRRKHSQVRYWIAMTGLMCCLVLPLAAWPFAPVPEISTITDAPIVFTGPAIDVSAIEYLPLVPTEPALPDVMPVQQIQWQFENWLPLATLAWLIGLVCFSVRPLMGLFAITRYKKVGTSKVPETVNHRFVELTSRLKISRPVRIARSSLAKVPMAMGFIKPVVLIPASTLTNLSAAELEAVIAHELAHLKRYDDFFNVIQTVVETLLFYHPCVWWMSSVIRAEREHCCDDIAVSVCGQPAALANALLRIEESRQPQPILTATGGPLVKRIRRLNEVDQLNKADRPLDFSHKTGKQGARNMNRRNGTICCICIFTLLLITGGSMFGGETSPPTATVSSMQENENQETKNDETGAPESDSDGIRSEQTQTGNVIESPDPDALEKIEEIIRLQSEQENERGTTTTFRTLNREAAEVKDTNETLNENGTLDQLSRIIADLELEGDLNFDFDVETGKIIYSGENPDDLEKVRTIVERLSSVQQGTETSQQDDALQQGADSLIQNLNLEGSVKVDFDRETGNVLVTGENAGDVAKVEAAIVSLMAGSRETEPAPEEDATHQQLDELVQNLQLQGDVKFDFDRQTGNMIVTGANPEDVAQVEAILKEVMSRSEENAPASNSIQLSNADATEVVAGIQEAYDAVFAPRFGPVTITASRRTNLIIVVGSDQAFEAVKQITSALDQPYTMPGDLQQNTDSEGVDQPEQDSARAPTSVSLLNDQSAEALQKRILLLKSDRDVLAERFGQAHPQIEALNKQIEVWQAHIREAAYFPKTNADVERKELLRQYLAMQVQHDELTSRLGPAHPQVESLNGQIAEIEAYLKVVPEQGLEASGFTNREELRRQLQSMKIRRDELFNRLGPGHPDTSSLNVQIEFWENQLAGSANNLNSDSLREQLIALEAESAALAGRYTERHPQRIAIEQQLETLKQQLSNMNEGNPEADENSQSTSRAAAPTNSTFLGIRSGDIAGGTGVRVAEVIPETSADAGGLQKDDVIISIANMKTDNPADLREAMAGLAPGNVVSFKFIRDGNEVTKLITLGGTAALPDGSRPSRANDEEDDNEAPLSPTRQSDSESSLKIDQLNLNVLEAQMRLKEKQEAVAHSEALFKKGFVTESQVDRDKLEKAQAALNLKVAYAELNTAFKNLEEIDNDTYQQFSNAARAFASQANESAETELKLSSLPLIELRVGSEGTFTNKWEHMEARISNSGIIDVSPVGRKTVMLKGVSVGETVVEFVSRNGETQKLRVVVK